MLGAQGGELFQKLEEMQRACEEQLAALRTEHAEELSRINEAHRTETESLKAAQREELSRINEAHRTETELLKAAHAETLSRINEAHRAETESLKAAHAEARARLLAEYDARLKEGESALAARGREAAQAEETLAEARERLSVVSRRCEVLCAEMTAIRKEYGLLNASDDFTTEEGFNALEHEFEVLGRLVRDEWTDVKKILRKEFYGGIRAAMHKKKPQKSKEYLELREQVNALRAPASETAEGSVTDGKIGEEQATDGETQTAGKNTDAE